MSATGIDFWAGILIGFALSVAFWFFTVKWLVARLQLPNELDEIEEDGRFRYQFRIKNVGHRDAVDVRVKCTSFSTQWAGDPANLIATIAIPTTYAQIDVMPGRSRLRTWTGRIRPIDRLGPRQITLKLEQITDLQKRKLDGLSPDLRERLEDRKLRLKELMDLGSESFLSVVVYAYDRLSGTRRVATNAAIGPDDILPAFP